MQGSLDTLCFPSGTKDYVKKLSGDVTLKFWEGCYHEIHNEPCWEEAIDYVIDWLDHHLN
jgi:alpha-beta hydrolase superfamily lysophospholipase